MRADAKNGNSTNAEKRDTLRKTVQQNSHAHTAIKKGTLRTNAEITQRVANLETTEVLTHGIKPTRRKTTTEKRILERISTTSALSAIETEIKYKRSYKSGATNYICNLRESFETFTSQLGWVQVGNREKVRTYGLGDVRVLTSVDARSVQSC